MNQTIRPATPGHILLTQFLEPNGISQTALATHTGWTRKHVNQLCRGKVTVTIDSALILAKVLGTDPDLWLSLQRTLICGMHYIQKTGAAGLKRLVLFTSAWRPKR